MTNVQRIRKGPHPTPRPSGEQTSNAFDENTFLGSYEQLPSGLKSRIAAAGLTAALLVGGVVYYNQHQGKPNTNSPAPTEADYKAQEGQPLNGS